MREIGDVEHLQSLAIGDERVAELHGDALRVVEIGRADFRRHARRERIIEVDDDEAAVAQNVRVRSRNRDAARAVQDSAGIERGRAADEIIFADFRPAACRRRDFSPSDRDCRQRSALRICP